MSNTTKSSLDKRAVNGSRFVRPSNTRNEHYDDIPKPWAVGIRGGSNGISVNGNGSVNGNIAGSSAFEIESILGGLPSSSLSSNAFKDGSALSFWSMFRGGYTVMNSLLYTFCINGITFFGKSKSRCYSLLVVTVIMESYATALSKQAKEVGSTALFLWSCFVNFFCLVGFNICLAQIEVSIAYAIWSALGTVLVAVVGILLFNESCDASKIVCLSLITIGVVGLNLRDDGGH